MSHGLKNVVVFFLTFMFFVWQRW